MMTMAEKSRQSPAMCFFCKDGDGHGIKNEGTEDLTFVALILKK